MPKPSRLVSTKQKLDLIAAVRTEKSLYDPKATNLKPKNGLWSHVATQCGMKRGKGLVAKLMWKNIYEGYLAFRKDPSKNQNETNYELFKRMTFIDRYLAKDKAPTPTGEPKSLPPTLTIIPSYKDTPQVKEENQEAAVVNVVQSSSTSTNINETTTNGEFTTFQYWNDTEDSSKSLKQLETNPTTLHSTTPINNHDDNACSELTSCSGIESYEDIILPDALNNSGTADNTSSLKMFFDAMFASTSQMPQVLQRMVKAKIFAAVLEAEEEAEKHKSSASGTG